MWKWLAPGMAKRVESGDLCLDRAVAWETPYRRSAMVSTLANTTFLVAYLVESLEYRLDD